MATPVPQSSEHSWRCRFTRWQSFSSRPVVRRLRRKSQSSRPSYARRTPSYAVNVKPVDAACRAACRTPRGPRLSGLAASRRMERGQHCPLPLSLEHHHSLLFLLFYLQVQCAEPCCSGNCTSCVAGRRKRPTANRAHAQNRRLVSCPYSEVPPQGCGIPVPSAR